jgi:hypothetical protein
VRDAGRWPALRRPARPFRFERRKLGRFAHRRGNLGIELAELPHGLVTRGFEVRQLGVRTGGPLAPFLDVPFRELSLDEIGGGLASEALA